MEFLTEPYWALPPTLRIASSETVGYISSFILASKACGESTMFQASCRLDTIVTWSPEMIL